MNKQQICIIGGSGFVGLHLCARLVKRGYRVRVLTRNAEAAKDLRVLPGVELRQADVRDPTVLESQFRGQAAVINLAGILNEHHQGGFQAVHVELPRRIVAACHAAGVRRLLHMSALKADLPDPPSEYLRSKGEGERLVLAADDLDATVFRPSVIFGPEDQFFNRFARLLATAPGVFPLACAEASFAPVYVGDVAEAFTRALCIKETIGQGYELCGPKPYSLREIVDYVARLSGHRRYIIDLGPRLSRLQARLMEFLPGKPFTRDNYRSMLCDSLCKSRFPSIFGITPTPVEAVVPTYLGPREHNHWLSELRRRARRD